jgi:hypothetical protein
MAILPNVIYRFHAITIKIPITFFTEMVKKKKILKVIWKLKRPLVAKAILNTLKSKKHSAESIIIPDLN